MTSPTPVHRYTQQGVACLTLDLPPVNALDLPLRAALADALDQALHDSQVQAVILLGEDRMFCGGANLAAFETDGLAEPTLHATINAMIEGASKPVIAAIHGVALGGGLELALSCHYRLWQRGSRFGLPEINLGFMPGAGGTQKLPRALGLLPALNLILTGKQVIIDDHENTALVDALVPADANLREAAIEFALALPSQGTPLPRLRDRKLNEPDAPATLQFARRQFGRGRHAKPGTGAAIDAVARCVDGTPFNVAMEREFLVFRDLAQQTPARALRYQFLAKRRAARPQLAPEALQQAPKVARAAVIGAGLMGSGIAFCLAQAGVEVNLTDRDPAARERADAAIARDLSSLQKRGKLNAASAQALRQRIRWTEGDATLADVDLALKAVVEDFAVKAEVLAWMDAKAPARALLASNTSTFDLDALAAATSRPQQVVGMHFFSPAPVMPVLEIVRTQYTADTTLAAALTLAERMRKTAVVAGVCDGFIGNRLIERYTDQALHLVAAGIEPARIDQALERFGMAMGPFRMLDMVGNDIPWQARQQRYAQQAEPRRNLADWICERGWFGQKTGLGWYRHEAGVKPPLPNPELPTLVAEFAQENGIAPIELDDDTIVQGCLLALINEGAKVVAEGIAERASDIDVLMVAGYGFPATRGGPMFHADEMGLVNVLRLLRREHEAAAANLSATASALEPAALIAERAAAGLPLHTAIFHSRHSQDAS